MPLLALRLVYTTAAGKQSIILNHALPKQPMRLVHYSVNFDSADANLKFLSVQLPFLNSFDCNTNLEIDDSIPLHIGGVQNIQSQMDLEFNISSNVQEGGSRFSGLRSRWKYIHY